MRGSSLLLLLCLSACDRHKSECGALEKIDPSSPNATAQIDAIGVRDAKLVPLASRYRAALVTESTKRDGAIAAARDALPGLSASAGAESSLDHVVADARPLIECLLERSAECEELLRVVDTCSRPAPGVSVSAQLGVCADALAAAKFAEPERVTAARDVTAAIRAFAPRTATITIDAAEVMKRFASALPVVREWQSAADERRARADDIRKACVMR